MSNGWAAVSARLEDARVYWVAVVDRKGAPRTFPRWGVVLNAALYFYVDGATGTALELRRDPRIAVNLEDGENVVLVRGVAEPVGGPDELPDVAAAFAAKYDNADDPRFPNTKPEPADNFYVLKPSWALWMEEAEPTAVRRVGRFGHDPRVHTWKAGEETP